MIIAIPLSVQAGVFSSLIEMFSEVPIEEEIIITQSQSAQDIKLLSAIINPDPLAALGGGDIFVEDGALVSGGPIGEDAFSDSKTTNGEISVYTVRAADTLSQIAEMYDVTTNTILWANDLSSRTIHEGQTLVILPIVGVRHVVKDGDTISTIAKKYEGNVEEILSYNQLASADELSIGDTLTIPGGEIAAPKQIRIAYSATPVSVSGNISSGGGFIHPLPGSLRTQGIHGYNGVDLASGAGTPIRAAAAGQVIVAKSYGWNGGYGNYVVVRHANGTQTLYAHNSSNAVGVGTYVAQGQTVAYVGSSGRSTGSHLHFEVRGASNPF